MRVLPRQAPCGCHGLGFLGDHFRSTTAHGCVRDASRAMTAMKVSGLARGHSDFVARIDSACRTDVTTAETRKYDKSSFCSGRPRRVCPYDYAGSSR